MSVAPSSSSPDSSVESCPITSWRFATSFKTLKSIALQSSGFLGDPHIPSLFICQRGDASSPVTLVTTAAWRERRLASRTSSACIFQKRSSRYEGSCDGSSRQPARRNQTQDHGKAPVGRLTRGRAGDTGVGCVFITAGPITKLFAGGEEESGGHVL